MAAASAAEPTRRARMAAWMRAALALLEDEESEPVVTVRPQHAHALREISDSLGLAAEHAAYLAEQAERITASPAQR